MRSADKLTWGQEHFLNDLVQAKDFDTVMRERKINPTLLLRWMTYVPFVEKWERCNRLLALRRVTETESAAIRVAQTQRAQLQASPPPPCAATGPAPQCEPEEFDPAPPREQKPAPQISERDAIRARHGEEAARAFDRLCQLRKQREQSAAANPAPTPAIQLADAPPALSEVEVPAPSAAEVQAPSSNAVEPRPDETPPPATQIEAPSESPQPEAKQ
jgi:hypothetical protein